MIFVEVVNKVFIIIMLIVSLFCILLNSIVMVFKRFFVSLDFFSMMFM